MKRISSYQTTYGCMRTKEMQYRHKALACLLFLHSLRSYSFLFSPSISFYMLICSSICMRAKHSCSLFPLVLTLSYFVDTSLVHVFFFSLVLFYSYYTTTSSFVRLLVRQHFEKKGQRKGEKINSNRQKKERHIVLQSLSLIHYKEKVKIESMCICHCELSTHTLRLLS